MRLAVNHQNHHHQHQQNLARNPHYENIYESIEQFATVNAPAPAPADNPQAQAPTAAPLNQNSGNRRINLRTRNHHFHYNNNVNASYSHPRNATLAYDIPRAARGNYYAANAMGTVNRRATLESNMNNRVRYANANRVAAAAALRQQRSFDDTESYHYSHYNNANAMNPFRYENIYEQIREEPIYRNVGLGRDNRLYGRLDVIGHGIGRIERHLSSSCGNIDHYNLGGTYAILGHSHLSTHVYASNNAKETAGKSLNFFSCLGRENSQSMSNICRESSNTQEAGAAVAQPSTSTSSSVAAVATNAIATTSTANAAAALAVVVPSSSNANENGSKSTGAIPKKKSKSKVQNSTCLSATNTAAAAAAASAAAATATAATIPHPIHSTALNRISKASLQYLLMNKWLPLWISNGSDCNVLDFNFMFARNCCESDNESNGAATYANGYRDFGPENSYYYSTLSSSSPRPRCYHNSLMRFNDSRLRHAYASNGRRWPPSYQRTNEMDYSNSMGYDANELYGNNYCASPPPPPENPFRQWELNSENNSFRPANVRRITDGTYPNGGQQVQLQPAAIPNGNAKGSAGNAQEVRLEINNQPLVEASTSTANSTPSTSRAVIASASGGAGGSSNISKIKNNNGELSSAISTATASASSSSSKGQLRFDRQLFESGGALSSSTESASETENKVRSPEMSVRRYSENTEDDQYNNSTGTSSSTDDDGDGGGGDGDDDENDDTISELHTIDTTDNSERIN